MRKTFVTLVAACLMFVAADAYAGGSDTGDTACGYAPATWNAPNGSIVFMRSDNGTFRAMVDQLGEYRTHVMLSHGLNGNHDRTGWVTHNTMHAPGTNNVCKACNEPLRAAELFGGYPGAARVQQGGVYTDIYAVGGKPENWGGLTASSALYYQGGDSNGQTVANTALACPVNKAVSQKDVYRDLFRYTWSDGTYIQYVPYGARSSELLGETTSPSTYKTSYGGATCSTYLAFLQRLTTKQAGLDLPVYRYTYSYDQTCNGLNAVYNQVYGDCQGSIGFWGKTGAGAACSTWCIFSGSGLDFAICDEAGNQVSRCFAKGNSQGACDNGGDDYSCGDLWGSTDPTGGSGGAKSISPDRLGGWGVHPVDASVWAYDINNPVSWNQGGNQYSCWF
jgi:hypothetical protein